MNTGVVAYFDGLCEPNPGGHACAGWVVEPCALLPDGMTGHVYIGHGEGTTNNVAEYRAALTVLESLYARGYRGPVLLRGDSQLVCYQFSGRYGCGSEHLAPLLARLQKAATVFAALTLEWVPRAQNEDADEQSRQAYIAVTGHEPPRRAGKVRPAPELSPGPEPLPTPLSTPPVQRCMQTRCMAPGTHLVGEAMWFCADHVGQATAEYAASKSQYERDLAEEIAASTCVKEECTAACTHLDRYGRASCGLHIWAVAPRVGDKQLVGWPCIVAPASALAPADAYWQAERVGT